VSAVILVLLAASGDANLLVGSDRLLDPASGEATSDAVRSVSTQTALHGFLEHPVFGAGYSVARDALNIYLQALHAGGLVGLLAFLGALFSAIGAALRHSHHAAYAGDRAISSALAVSIGVWLVFGIFQNAIYDRYLFVPSGLILATTVARQMARSNDRQRRPSVGRNRPKTGYGLEPARRINV
jgi:hypothetical protein